MHVEVRRDTQMASFLFSDTEPSRRTRIVPCQNASPRLKPHSSASPKRTRFWATRAREGATIETFSSLRRPLRPRVTTSTLARRPTRSPLRFSGSLATTLHAALQALGGLEARHMDNSRGTRLASPWVVIVSAPVWPHRPIHLSCSITCSKQTLPRARWVKAWQTTLSLRTIEGWPIPMVSASAWLLRGERRRIR